MILRLRLYLSDGSTTAPDEGNEDFVIDDTIGWDNGPEDTAEVEVEEEELELDLADSIASGTVQLQVSFLVSDRLHLRNAAHRVQNHPWRTATSHRYCYRWTSWEAHLHVVTTLRCLTATGETCKSISSLYPPAATLLDSSCAEYLCQHLEKSILAQFRQVIIMTTIKQQFHGGLLHTCSVV